jgi:hypothetical protein
MGGKPGPETGTPALKGPPEGAPNTPGPIYMHQLPVNKNFLKKEPAQRHVPPLSVLILSVLCLFASL